MVNSLRNLEETYSADPEPDARGYAPPAPKAGICIPIPFRPPTSLRRFFPVRHKKVHYLYSRKLGQLIPILEIYLPERLMCKRG